MRAENLFKFVAIRKPRPSRVDRTPPVTFPDTTFVDRIRARVGDRVPLAEARRAVGTAVMDSTEYILRSPLWKPFLALEDQARRVLDDARAGVDLRMGVEQFLAAATGGPVGVSSFVAGAEFRTMKQILWHSYYSNVALVDRRAMDRVRMLFWIRFWHLLERLAAGEPPGPLVAEFDLWLPAVPHELAHAERPSESVPARKTGAGSLAERRAKVATLRHSLDELRAAQAHLRHLARAKLAATTADRPPARGRATVPGTTIAAGPPPSAAMPSPASVVIRASEADNGNGFDDGGQAPWRPRAEEIDPAVLATLDRLGVSAAQHDLPEMTARVERRLAAATSELYDLEHTDQIVLMRGVPVRRRRRLSATELGLEARDEA